MIYREKLSCPVSYWAIAGAVGLSFVTAVGFYFGPGFAVGSAVVSAAGIAAALIVIGRDTIEVDGRGLTVGRSVLEWPYVGEARAHDDGATKARLGPDADVRAFVVERPYIPDSVEVAVEDPADPHPYWIVSTRRPRQLLAALARGRTEAGREACRG